MLGQDIWALSDLERDEIYKKIGIVYQGGALFGSLTVADNVALPLREHTRLAPNIIDITARMKLGLVGPRRFRAPAAQPALGRSGEARRLRARDRHGPADPVLRRAVARASTPASAAASTT